MPGLEPIELNHCKPGLGQGLSGYCWTYWKWK